jgi:hypothetical protein
MIATEKAMGSSISPAFIIESTVAEGERPGIQITHTTPDRISFHVIEDHELEVLMSISPPKWFAVSMVTLGAFLGLVPEGINSFLRAHSHEVQASLYDMIVGAVWLSCLVACILTFIFARPGLRQANEALRSIRQRPHSPIVMGARDEGEARSESRSA